MSQQKKMEQSTKIVMDTIHSLIIHSIGSSYIQTLIRASGQVEIQRHSIPRVISGVTKVCIKVNEAQKIGQGWVGGGLLLIVCMVREEVQAVRTAWQE